ncbi:GNAT family N-acetyltransferase [Paenibacillus agilis]|uniref:GNAT family N-acetyltransferase n=1 Tax=Paenibacillus agilis TaxID=3020863 RepID=A0A559J3G0_9BACL|nr:GNAT family N-acetyltransferase [Paenibacillus agilis]TVX94419.1 GNAT family N-acetyltransferase [Paenibacillus agilis]
MIREAEARDAEEIERLYKELLPTNANVKVLGERLEYIKLSTNSYLFVYEDEDRIIGTAHVHLCADALSGHQPFAVVERVIVSGEYQGRGYGAKLMNHIEQLCKELHCVKIMLTSQSQREQAHEFYTRLGYDGTGSKAFKKYV